MTRGAGAWKWAGTEENLRANLERNASLTKGLVSDRRLAETYPDAMARTPRANGVIGLESDLDLDKWRVMVDDSKPWTLEQIKALPRFEMTTELRCIEGWSTVVRWSGVRFRDFAARCGVNPASTYVSLTTPDEDYYVGLDMASALHPQTMLCSEMNGEPLDADHGAPLRLVIPVKYGIKNLKRIGNIRFSQQRPKDYWAEQGYDWFAGL
jgi:DMSO/TMAO reductase YedYZ molybdopterin-dependent catalytic subunit